MYSSFYLSCFAGPNHPWLSRWLIGWLSLFPHFWPFFLWQWSSQIVYRNKKEEITLFMWFGWEPVYIHEGKILSLCYLILFTLESTELVMSHWSWPFWLSIYLYFPIDWWRKSRLYLCMLCLRSCAYVAFVFLFINSDMLFCYSCFFHDFTDAMWLAQHAFAVFISDCCSHSFCFCFIVIFCI